MASQATNVRRAAVSALRAWAKGHIYMDSLIERQAAILNPREAGFQILVLLAVAMTEHTDANRQDFERHVQSLPEVTECYSVSGERDYILQVIVRDMEAYNNFLNSQVLKHSAVRSASSTFVLRRVKFTTHLSMSA